MKIRTATLDDIPALVQMGALMHAESPRYSRLSYSAEKVEKTLRIMIGNPEALVVVAEIDNVIQGAALAFTEEEWFSYDRVGCELTLFVNQNRRGALIGAKLIAVMDDWGQKKGVPYFQGGATTGVNPERTAGLYEHMGWSRCGIGFERVYH